MPQPPQVFGYFWASLRQGLHPKPFGLALNFEAALLKQLPQAL